MAGDGPSTPSRVSGRPLKRTTTNGLPVALIRAISSCCRPGRSISLREAASPLWPRDSPRASTTWSAALATATASSKPALEPHSSAGVLLGGSLSAIEQPSA
jgi:hypothetical protein